MANIRAEQTLLDGDRNVVISCTGTLDTSDLALSLLVDVSTLVPAPTFVRVDKIEYSLSGVLGVQLLWEATADDPLANLAGQGELCYEAAGGLQNPRTAGSNGDILIKTTGWSAGAVLTYTITLYLVKQGV